MDRHYPTPKDLPVVHRPSTEYLKMAKVALGASDRPLSYLKMLKDALAPRETSYQGLWEQRRARGLSAARVSKPAGRGITTSWRVQEEEAPEGKGMAALVRAMEGVAIQGTEVYGRELMWWGVSDSPGGKRSEGGGVGGVAGLERNLDREKRVVWTMK